MCEVSASIGECLGVSGSIWEYLKVSESLGVSGNVWQAAEGWRLEAEGWRLEARGSRLVARAGGAGGSRLKTVQPLAQKTASWCRQVLGSKIGPNNRRMRTAAGVQVR